MNKTIKQIADELEIDKQKVYRYIKKNHINEVVGSTSVKYYDETVQRQIKQYFSKKTTSNEVHQSTSKALNETVNETLIEMLKNELEMKNKQIAELQKLIDQEQKLNMSLQNKVLSIIDNSNENDDVAAADQEEDKKTELKVGFLKRIFKK